jgi:hypothetical protein
MEICEIIKQIKFIIMKKLILIFTVSGVVLLTGLNASAQENKKAAEARKDLEQAKKDLRIAKDDSIADYQKFKVDSELKIIDNKKKIAELKAKKSVENKEVKEKYDKKVLALEEKNNDLKKKLDASNTVKSTAWSSFKREFNHDIEELGRAFKDIGINNEK